MIRVCKGHTFQIGGDRHKNQYNVLPVRGMTTTQNTEEAQMRDNSLDLVVFYFLQSMGITNVLMT